MSRLGLKILIVFLLISLGGLTLASFLINRSINNNFRDYLSEKRREADEQIVTVIENLYQERGNWAEIIPELMKLDIVSGRFIRIEDRYGNSIYNSFEYNRGMMRDSMMRGMMRGMMGRHYNLSPDIFKYARSYDLTIKGEKIGRVFISSPEQPGLLTARDRYFTERINKAILWAAGLIALVTILVSIYFSRRLSRPLLEMSEATQKIAEGRFEQRINVSGSDELGRLGIAFNEMAGKLEHLEKIRQESTSDLAHELRTPLTTMRSYLEAMEDGVIPPSKENISSLHSELMRLVRLVNRLGELAEVEGKIINLKKEELNLLDLVERVGERFLPLAGEKGIDFRVRAEDRGLIINGDQDSIEQIFSNLFSNAIKYTNPGGKIEVSLEKKNDRVRVVVKDTGIGIAREDLPYIFERFYRADKSRSRGTGGTGIGLTLTKKLVEAHDGQIFVRSKLGEGTEFTILFPLSHIL
ncbi:MAG: hypothetical protein PWR10_1485 [Halanaerobiales bacterium]|nr:hypothetical protein [Halanaerobiales bacterium]